MSDTELPMTLKDLLILVSRATWALDHEDQRDAVLNFLAAELEDRWGISHADLSQTMDEIGLTLPEEEEEEVVCGHCKDDRATMHNDMTDEGRVCADCYWDLNEEMKRERARRIP
jgi:hypothetical protein